MPEFILEHGTAEASRRFAALDEFTRGYIEALFFTNASDPDDGLLASSTVADLATETLAAIVEDCRRFQEENRDALALAIHHAKHPRRAMDDASAGRDFWYTRNGHGCGFWDGDWPEPYASELTASARSFRSVDVYAGDDGRVYLA